MSSSLPDTHGNKKFKLIDFVSLKTLQRIQDNLAYALGISLIITDSETGQAITKRSNMSVFCEKMRKSDEFDKSCVDERMRCGGKVSNFNRSFVFKCHAGLYGFSVPIMVSGRIVAFFRGGEVRSSNPDIAQCKEISDKYGIDFDSYLEAFLGLPLFSENKINAVVELLSVIANTISNLAFTGELAKNEATELVHLNDLLEHEVMRKTDELSLSEEKYRSIFENAPDVIYSIDANGFITDVNNVISKSLGYEKDYVVGSNFKDFVYKDDLQIVAQSFHDLKEHTREFTKGLRFRIKSLTGVPVYFELNSRAVYDGDGDLVRIDGILRNIDRALKLEQDLRTVKEKYKELFDAMRDGVYMTDENGIIRVFNKGALRILGYSTLDEVLGRPITDFYVNPDDRTGFLKKLAEKGFAENYVVKLRRKDGTSVYVEATSNQMRGEDGIVKGVEGVFRDATEKVRLKKELELMKHYLEDLIECAGYGIIGVDRKGRIFVWNKGAEELFGEKADDVVGRDVSAIIPRYWREHKSNLIDKVLQGDVIRDVKATRELGDGKSIDISLTLSPIKDSKGDIVGASAIVHKEDK